MFYRSQRIRVTAPHDDTLMTKQSHKEECDILNILKQYQRTGVITHVAPGQPNYMDLPDNLDYQAALETIQQGQEAFASLPAKCREYFDNNPETFLAALYDSKQHDKLREFGVFKALEVKPLDATRQEPSTSP